MILIRVVEVSEDDTPDVHEAMLKAEREKMFEKNGTREGRMIVVELVSPKRRDDEDSRPSDSGEHDKP